MERYNSAVRKQAGAGGRAPEMEREARDEEDRTLGSCFCSSSGVIFATHHIHKLEGKICTYMDFCEFKEELRKEGR